MMILEPVVAVASDDAIRNSIKDLEGFFEHTINSVGDLRCDDVLWIFHNIYRPKPEKGEMMSWEFLNIRACRLAPKRVYALLNNQTSE